MIDFAIIAQRMVAESARDDAPRDDNYGLNSNVIAHLPSHLTKEEISALKGKVGGGLLAIKLEG